MMLSKALYAAIIVVSCRLRACLAVELDIASSLNLTSTVGPALCRVQRKTHTCADESFRLACPHWCDISCPGPGFVYVDFRHTCYAMTRHETAYWSHAQEHCRAYGARLARIESLEDSRVVAFLKNSTSHPSNQTWYSVGVANIGVTDVWAWRDGSRLTVGGELWAGGYPWFEPNKPGCGYIVTGDPDRRENNVCNQHMGFICEQTPFVSDLYDKSGLPMAASTSSPASVDVAPNLPTDLL